LETAERLTRPRAGRGSSTARPSRLPNRAWSAWSFSAIEVGLPSQRKSGARSPWSRTASAKAMRSYCWKSAKLSSTYRRRACKVSSSAGVVLELGEPPPRPELEQIAADERLTVLLSGAQSLLDGGCADRPKNAPMSAAKTVAITSPSYDWLAALPSNPGSRRASPAAPPTPEPVIAARRLTHTAPPETTPTPKAPISNLSTAGLAGPAFAITDEASPFALLSTHLIRGQQCAGAPLIDGGLPHRVATR
jgi:hypothetical protein